MGVETGTAIIVGSVVAAAAAGGSAYYSAEQQKKAAKKQERQANALIAEQGKAAETAKENAVNQRRASMMGQSKTNYTTALGEYGQTESGTSVKKKTLLGG